MCCPFSRCETCQTCVQGYRFGCDSFSSSCPPTLLDEMEDRRQRDKEKRVSPIYPWGHMCRAARETEEQPHKLVPLNEPPTGRNNQSMRVKKPFSYQEIQRIKEDLGDYLEDPEKQFLKVLLCFMTLLGRM